MKWITGYCTNVHPGADLLTTRQQLAEKTVAVKRLVSPDQPMGFGLWLSAGCAATICREQQLDAFADWLGEAGLVPFTLNGFPYGDFHQAVVKHDVYWPTWSDPARVEYTLGLIEIQDRLLPPGLEGSISTLPLAWGQPPPGPDPLKQYAANLCRIAERLANLEAECGRLIYLCLEPEPGCVLQRSEDVVRFFEDYLLPDRDEQLLRRYLRVCHDVCHAAVMFEGQAAALRRYRQAGILVGKIQVSSAVVLDWDRTAAEQRAAAVDQLRKFAEDRYLHQTTIGGSSGSATAFCDDLPPALAAITDPSQLAGQWRVHFHLPIYLERFGHLGTSRDAIRDCLREIGSHPELTHLEVETYAWNVLPAELRQPHLANGIAQELRWLHEQLA